MLGITGMAFGSPTNANVAKRVHTLRPPSPSLRPLSVRTVGATGAPAQFPSDILYEKHQINSQFKLSLPLLLFEYAALILPHSPEIHDSASLR